MSTHEAYRADLAEGREGTTRPLGTAAGDVRFKEDRSYYPASGTKGRGTGTGERLEEGARSAIDTGARTGAAIGETGLRGAQAAGDTAVRGAQVAGDTAVRGAQVAGDTAIRGAQAVGDTAVQAGRFGADVAGRGFDMAYRGAAAAGQTAKDLTMSGMQTASDLASGAWRTTIDTGKIAMGEAQAQASRAADTQARIFDTAPLQQYAHAKGVMHPQRQGMTPLQQHLEFFDRDHNGIIYPNETYAGFRAIGYGRIISLLAVILIHFWFSYPSQNSWIPDLFFWSIRLENSHKLKHGSDAEIYTHDGYFDARFFDKLFEEYGHNGKMNFKDVFRMTQNKREAMDLFGWMAAKLEWGFTYWSLRDVNGEISKEDVKKMYDGSVLYELEDRYARQKMRRKMD